MVERSEIFRDQEKQPIGVTMDGQNVEMLQRHKTESTSTQIALAGKIDQNLLVSYCMYLLFNA